MAASYQAQCKENWIQAEPVKKKNRVYSYLLDQNDHNLVTMQLQWL